MLAGAAPCSTAALPAHPPLPHTAAACRAEEPHGGGTAEGTNDTAAHVNGTGTEGASGRGSSSPSSSFERKVRRAKRAARSELSVSRGEWRKHGYASSPDLLRTEGLPDTLSRLDGSSLSLEEFVERFEAPRQPCVITGLTAGWPAAEAWTPDRLLQRLGECKFKVGVGGGWPRQG